jgi:hypothetical protein
MYFSEPPTVSWCPKTLATPMTEAPLWIRSDSQLSRRVSPRRSSRCGPGQRADVPATGRILGRRPADLSPHQPRAADHSAVSSAAKQRMAPPRTLSSAPMCEALQACNSIRDCCTKVATSSSVIKNLVRGKCKAKLLRRGASDRITFSRDKRHCCQGVLALELRLASFYLTELTAKQQRRLGSLRC